MVLAMIEVAALEVLERIKTVDASFTWPHPTDKGYLVSASFVRTEDNKPYLFYCPKARIEEFSLNQEILEEYINNFTYSTAVQTRFIQELSCCERRDRPQFFIIPLGSTLLKEVKKEDVEKMFGIKVV